MRGRVLDVVDEEEADAGTVYNYLGLSSASSGPTVTTAMSIHLLYNSMTSSPERFVPTRLPTWPSLPSHIEMRWLGKVKSACLSNSIQRIAWQTRTSSTPQAGEVPNSTKSLPYETQIIPHVSEVPLALLLLSIKHVHLVLWLQPTPYGFFS